MMYMPRPVLGKESDKGVYSVRRHLRTTLISIHVPEKRLWQTQRHTRDRINVPTSVHTHTLLSFPRGHVAGPWAQRLSGRRHQWVWIMNRPSAQAKDRRRMQKLSCISKVVWAPGPPSMPVPMPTLGARLLSARRAWLHYLYT